MNRRIYRLFYIVTYTVISATCKLFCRKESLSFFPFNEIIFITVKKTKKYINLYKMHLTRIPIYEKKLQK